MIYRLYVVLYTPLFILAAFLFYANWMYFRDIWGNVNSSPWSPNNLPPYMLDVLSLYSFDPILDTIQLTKEELQYVSRRHEIFVSFNASDTHRVCPNRYIVARADVYGRHHNQLEEYMNIILWAERLNRTAVLGKFRVQNELVHPEKLYDFSKIAERYCVITDKEFRKNLNRTHILENGTYACYGLCVEYTPLAPLFQRMRLKKRVPGFPPNFPWVDHEFFVRRAIQFFLKEEADVMVIGGQYAFSLHHGLLQHAMIFSLLQPSPFVRKKVDEFINFSFSPRKGYFAIHKRHRESSCKASMKEKLPFLRQYTNLPSERVQQLNHQCNISIPYLAALHHSLGLELFSFPLFVAHDNQDLITIPKLAAQGARMYDKKYYAKFEDCEYGLCALAVDFFLLIEGEYFSGNVVSSVTQNVCFVRLGRGQACHGMEKGIIRMLTHDMLEPYIHYT